ncbi:MAG: mechanosensitive ion channel family protein [Candidatus Bathyarchaeia archaeon]
MTVDIYGGLAIQVATIIVLLAATYIIGRAVGSVLRAALRKTGMYETDAIVISSASKYLVWILGVFIVLGHLSIQVTPYLVTLLAVSLVLTWIVARAPIENVVSWYLLRNWGQFEVGDFVRIGVVRGLDLLQLTVETAENGFYSIPNTKVVSLGGYKFQRQNNLCPAAVRVKLPRDMDVERIKLKILQIIQGFTHLSADKPIRIMVEQFTDRSIVIEILFWVPKLNDILLAKDYIATKVLREILQVSQPSLEEAAPSDIRQREALMSEKRAAQCNACGSTAWRGFLKCIECGSYYVFGQCMNCDKRRFDRCPMDGGELEIILVW